MIIAVTEKGENNMPELNREEIIKALECCSKSHCSAENNADCPLINDESCACTLPQNALTLIKQLTEENERLKEKADRHLDNLKAVLEERGENTIVADTVREIKTRFALRYGTYTDKYMTPITEVFWLLDRIANEILNNTEDEEK
jgi:hypothetical protein